MPDEKKERKPAGLDLSDFTAPPTSAISKNTIKKNSDSRPLSVQDADAVMIAAQRSASETGFTSRIADGGRIDGRKLRRTGRDVQMNIKVSEATKARFWQIAEKSEDRAAGAVLEMLIDHYLANR